jgi:hypothetical protein
MFCASSICTLLGSCDGPMKTRQDCDVAALLEVNKEVLLIRTTSNIQHARNAWNILPPGG